MVIGIAGGTLLYRPQTYGLAAFVLLIVYSIFDSADGQLARLTNQASEFGRVLDGAIGYVVYTAVYLALTLGLLERGAPPAIVVVMLLAVLSNIAQAQMYEYHRHQYVMVVVKGRVLLDDPAKVHSPLVAWIYQRYLAMQRALNGLHVEVERTLAARAENGVVPERDRLRYRQHFYWPVRGWNLLGDNTRFYAIGVLAWCGRLDLFFLVLLLPLNLALAVLWFWQRRADRAFLREP